MDLPKGIKYDNHGLQASDCSSIQLVFWSEIGKKSMRIWKKEEEIKEKWNLALCGKDKEDQWYIDYRCSNHMTWDKSIFISLKEVKDDNVILENNTPTRIIGKIFVGIDNEKNKATNVLLIDGLKNNILSVIQMVDNEHEVIFSCKGCKIREEESSRLVITRTGPQEMHVLHKGKCSKRVLSILAYQ